MHHILHRGRNMIKQTLLIITALTSSLTFAANDFVKYGEPLKPFYETKYGDFFASTGQLETVSDMTCKMTRGGIRVPNLTLEVSINGVQYRKDELYKFVHVVIKKNGKVVNQLTPDYQYDPAPFVFMDTPYIDGTQHTFGKGWAINFNAYAMDGYLYFGKIESFAKATPRYALVDCTETEPKKVPVYERTYELSEHKEIAPL